MQRNYPIKILYFITGLDIGGAEQLLFLTLKNLDREKYLPSVVCFYRGVLACEIEQLGIEVIDLKAKSKFDFLAICRLFRLLKKEEIDIMHTHLFHANIIGRIVGRLCKVPIIVSTHHYAFSYNGKIGILLEKITQRLSDKIITVSEAAKIFYLKEIGIVQDRLTLIYNGIDTDIDKEAVFGTSDLRNELLLNNNFIVGCVGRFAEMKGQEYLIRATAGVIKEGYKIKLLLVGYGALKTHLKKLADTLGITREVIFLEARRDIPQIINTFDIYVSSSLQEGLSITLLEALAMGKPTIATAVGGNTEVILHGQSGILIPPRDNKALVEAIVNLIEDKKKAGQLGINGRQRVLDTFNIKDKVKETELLYDSLIREARR